MALGYTTYKTPNAIFKITEDLTDKEGCGVYLASPNLVNVATSNSEIPYGIITVGGASADGTYAPGVIGGAAIELVDQLGCVVQVLISGEDSVTAGQFLYIDTAVQDGTFTHAFPQNFSVGEWVWGYALTDAGPGEQCLMRFQPYQIQYVAP
jgi:hypothetical protein